MQLESLKIGRSWRSKRLEGNITFNNQLGEVSLRLTSDQVEKIFLICAESIEATAKEAAQELTCSVIEHRELIESKGDL
jgi:hypothetical protein